jgi:hypothetical protein
MSSNSNADGARSPSPATAESIIDSKKDKKEKDKKEKKDKKDKKDKKEKESSSNNNSTHHNHQHADGQKEVCYCEK